MIKINPLLIALSLLLFSCGPKPKEEVEIDPKKLSQQFQEANKKYLIKEKDEIEAYIKAHKYNMSQNGRGLYYMIVVSNPKGDKIGDGDVVKVNYTVRLLDGTECYSSNTDGAKTFKVNMDNVESGLHDAVQQMRVGEKSLCIIPSHLAHGLLGDINKIPPKASIIYEIEVLEKIKQP